jgi:hypothetical protein
MSGAVASSAERARFFQIASSVAGRVYALCSIDCLPRLFRNPMKAVSTELSPHRSSKLPTWYTNWIASLPLVLLTVLVHVSCLAAIKNRAIDLVDQAAARGSRNFVFVLMIGCTVLLVTMLHAIDAAVWGVAYLLLGAVPDSHSAMLYSLGAMTTYGNPSVNLEAQWQLMGVVESLNGVILFGFTVATLFSINDKIPAGTGNKARHD